MSFQKPSHWSWYLLGPAISVVTLLFTAAVAWLFFGDGNSNWFVQHALFLKDSLIGLPQELPLISKFWIVTLPAIVFSPFAEEFLYRGYILRVFETKSGVGIAILIQAIAFSFVHLAHYGLNPIQPALILVWLPSMFLAAIVFGWILIKSQSIWCAIISHAAYNLGMNAVVFVFYPSYLGV